MQYRPKKIDYTSPASAQGGPGVSKQITWYFGTPFIDMTAAVFSGVQQAIGASPGDIWWLGGQSPASGGNAFMFVKAAVGLALGQLVTPDAPVASTIAAGPPLSTAAFITAGLSTLGGVVNGEVDNWVFVTSAAVGATNPQLRRVKANTLSATAAFTVALQDSLRPNNPTDRDVFDSIPVVGEVINLIRPYTMKVCTATTVPVGVALGTVTAGNFTIIQVAGLAAVIGDGNVVDITAMQPAVPMAGGVMTGSAAAAASLYTGAGLILPLVGKADAGPFLLPAFINFTGQ